MLKLTLLNNKFRRKNILVGEMVLLADLETGMTISFYP